MNVESVSYNELEYNQLYVITHESSSAKIICMKSRCYGLPYNRDVIIILRDDCRAFNLGVYELDYFSAFKFCRINLQLNTTV